MATKMSRNKRLRKHLGSFAIAGVVLLLLVFVSVGSLSLRASNMNKQEKIDELNTLILEEKKNKESIDKYDEYVNLENDEFVKKVAREKLGLVCEDEIIFKAED